MNKIFKRNGSLSQKVKPIIVERVSYCIQFQIGTKTVKILTIHKINQASERIIIYLPEWREHESKRNKKNLEKNWLYLSHLREKKYWF